MGINHPPRFRVSASDVRVVGLNQRMANERLSPAMVCSFSRHVWFIRPPSKASFAKILLKKIRDAGGTTDYVFDEDRFEIRSATKCGFLGNVYAAYCDARGDHRNMILTNYITACLLDDKGVSEPPFDDVRSQIIPITRSFYAS